VIGGVCHAACSADAWWRDAGHPESMALWVQRIRNRGNRGHELYPRVNSHLFAPHKRQKLRNSGLKTHPKERQFTLGCNACPFSTFFRIPRFARRDSRAVLSSGWGGGGDQRTTERSPPRSEDPHTLATVSVITHLYSYIPRFARRLLYFGLHAPVCVLHHYLLSEGRARSCPSSPPLSVRVNRTA
jgi:hypothetical protein